MQKKHKKRSSRVLLPTVRRKRAAVDAQAGLDPTALAALKAVTQKIRERLLGDVELLRLLGEGVAQAGALYGIPTPLVDDVVERFFTLETLVEGVQHLSGQLRQLGYAEGFAAGQEQALREYGLEALARAGEGVAPDDSDFEEA